MHNISRRHASHDDFARPNGIRHPVFPEEDQKPARPDPDTPYQPTEPDEPDVQPEIIGKHACIVWQWCSLPRSAGKLHQEE